MIAHIFRVDLRIHDNTALIVASKKAETVLPVFIFNPRQVKNNPLKSDNCVQFMVESLVNLDEALQAQGSRLLCCFGDDAAVCAELLNLGVQLFTSALDYTLYSRLRSTTIKAKVPLELYDDRLLNPLSDKILKPDGTHYVKFTPFYNKALLIKPRKPDHYQIKNFMAAKDIDALHRKLKHAYSLHQAKSLYTPNPHIHLHGGRSNALVILGKSKQSQSDYDNTRNILSIDTSNMSAFNKFGCVSIREVYEAFHGKTSLIRQLYWRDFYYRIAWYHPNILGPLISESKRAFRETKTHWFSNIIGHGKQPTDTAIKHLEAWKSGNTGFPIVDAAMRQLNISGYMHNRGRLIVSSFLIKDLNWHWEEGEQYFATKLYDYDPSQNNGGWQWESGTGTDSSQYSRVFNPITQAEKCDPDCIYIKRWIPELKDVPNNIIHKWDEISDDLINYPRPIVDHKKVTENIRKIYIPY